MGRLTSSQLALGENNPFNEAVVCIDIICSFDELSLLVVNKDSYSTQIIDL